MALRDCKQAVLAGIVSVSPLLTLIGCDQGPAYHYQNMSEVALGAKASISEGSGGNKVAAASHESAPAAKPEPAMPDLSVKDLLLNDKTYDGKKVKVSGKLGQIMPLYSRSFIINKTDDLDIEFSYGQLSATEKAVLNNIVPMGAVSIVGIWDSSKRVLVGEELVR